MARQQEAPTNLGMLPGDDDGKVRETPHGPEVLRMPDSGFLAQLAMPNARTFDMPSDDGAMRTYVLDAVNESFAVLSRDGDGLDNPGGRPGVAVGRGRAVPRAVARSRGSPAATEFGVERPAGPNEFGWKTPPRPSWRLPVVPNS